MTRRRRYPFRATAIALLTAMAITVTVNPAHAASIGWAGKDPYSTGCSSGARYLGTWRAWGPWGEVAAYVGVWHSDRCGTAWLDAIAPTSTYIGTTSYIWNPGKPAQAVRLDSSWYRNSSMVDDRPGVQTCLGTHVYRYGRWFAWNFHLCYY